MRYDIRNNHSEYKSEKDYNFAMCKIVFVHSVQENFFEMTFNQV